MDVTSDIKGVDNKALAALVTTKTGETYNADQVENTVQALTDELGRQGYAFVDVQPQVKKDLQKRIIDIDYTRSEEHTSELQSLMRISYAVFCLKKKNKK